jgi:phosphatidylserine/phosphatidylglycerophosphate/cardiolipin synthase-like enzyme
MSNKVQIIALFDETASKLEMYQEQKDEILDLLRQGRLATSDFGALRAYLFDKASELVNSDNGSKTIAWLEESVKLLDRAKEQPKNPTPEVYFSPGEDCRNRIQLAILGAKSSIDICVFTISDNLISDTILQKHKEGIKIRVISDNDKCNDAGSDVYDLSMKNVPVKTDASPAHMHHKFVVIDNCITITGSYNWTKSAAIENQENIIALHDERIASFYLKEFERLWDNTISY